MARDKTWQTSAGTLCWLLAFAGFVTLLGGIAAMQKSCGAQGNVNQVLGAISYLAPVPCDRFFSLDWFIVFFHAFVWALVGLFLFSRKTHVARPLVTSLLAVAAVLLIFQTNTWYRPWSGLGQFTTSTFSKRSKVAFAGAMICAIADLALLILLGIQSEKDHDVETRTYKEGPVGTTSAHTVGVHAGHPGEATTTTTTTGAGAYPTTGAAAV